MKSNMRELNTVHNISDNPQSNCKHGLEKAHVIFLRNYKLKLSMNKVLFPFLLHTLVFSLYGAALHLFGDSLKKIVSEWSDLDQSTPLWIQSKSVLLCLVELLYSKNFYFVRTDAAL